MVDVDTFLTILYVMIDDFCQSHPPKRRPGPKASLSESEVVTLAIFARWGRFASERDFYGYARSCLRDAFPTLPVRSQFNRLVRSHLGLIEGFISHLVRLLGVRERPYQALDSSAMPVRDAKRRGAGWLAGYADVGWSNSLGWYEGFRLLTAVDPTGVVTGFGFSAASTADQQMAETFFAARAWPNPRLRSAGSVALGPYVVSTRASKAPKTIDGGSIAMERGSSVRPNATPAVRYGLNRSGAGWLAFVRSWRVSTISCLTLSVCGRSGPTS